ncbi:MAG: hypothetical protein JWN70_1644 [Planctomycetaceae bacterium]|nr:hypothetical protein [Planctomycetaceae bacterium]
MSGDFDPYYKWLGIVPQERPPHHYLLLGLVPFEADPQVIDAAADRQMTFIRKHQAGEHAADSQRLLNEIARARLCLLKSQSKETYDAELRRRLHPPVELTDVAVLPTPRQPKATKKAPAIPQATVLIVASVCGGLLTLLLIAGLSAFLSARPPVPVPALPQPLVRAEPVTAEQPSLFAPAANPAPAKPEPQVFPAAAMDVLAMLKPQHVIRGQWRVDPQSLKSIGATPHAEFALPEPVSAEYTLHVEGIRQPASNSSPKSDVLGLGLVCSGHEILFVMNGMPGTETSGLSLLDGHDWRDNETTLAGFCPQINQPFALDAIVRKDGIEIRFNDRTIVDWRGDPSRLKRPPEWKVVKPGALTIAAESPYEFKKITLGDPLPRRNFPGGDLRPGLSAELLKYVDLGRDVWSGRWIFNDLILLNANPLAYSRFSIPYELPAEYELVTEIESTDPKFGLYLGLPSGENRVAAIVGGHAGTLSGIFVDGAWDALPELTIHGQVIPVNRRVQIVTTVRPNQFVVKVGDQVLVNWKGEQRRCQRSVLFATPGNRLTLGNLGIGCRIYSMRVTRLAPAAPFPTPGAPQNGDLLSIADPERDATLSSWTLAAGRLVSSPSQVAALHFPARLPQNYEVRVVVERKSGNQDLAISLPIAGRSAMVVIDGERSRGKPQSMSGVEWFEGRRVYDNSTCVELPRPQLPTGRVGIILARVTGRHLQVDFNHQKVLDLDIPPDLIDPTWSMRPNWLNAEERLRLALASYRSTFEFREVRYRSLDDNSPPFPPVN